MIAPKSAIPTYTNHETVKDIAAPGRTINLYAIWKPNNDYTYKVRFHAMDGTGRTFDQTFAKSKSKCLAWLDSGIGWSRPGYIFCGWSDVGSSRVCKYNNGTKVYDLSFTPNGVVDLYAVWLSTSLPASCLLRAMMVSSRLSIFLSRRNFSGSPTNPAGSGRAPFVASAPRAEELDVLLPGLGEDPLDLAPVGDGLLDERQEPRLDVHRAELPVLAVGVLHGGVHFAGLALLALPRVPARLVAYADGALCERHERGDLREQRVAFLFRHLCIHAVWCIIEYTNAQE